MDFSNPLGAVDRVVKQTSHNGQSVRIVSGSTTFNTPSDDLWDAVTSASRIPRWFLPIGGELQMGGRYQLEGHAGGQITSCDPANAFDVTWECGENTSWVHVRLAADGDQTRLTLEHAMPMDEASEEHWRKYGPGATGVGWDLGLVGLALHIRTGETVQQEESHAWMASDEGKQFIRESASAWGEAHVSSGEDAGIATEMARQTALFYCGESEARD